MRSATPSASRLLGWLTAALVALALVPGARAESPLVVPTPTASVPNPLNSTIENDTNRPADRVYVLQRGVYYGVTREINNGGTGAYTLRIRAAAGTGPRPVIYPAPDASGTPPGSRYFNLGASTYFTDIYFLASDPSQGQVATAFALNGVGMRFVATNCVFQGGTSRLIEINVENTKLIITDSQFRNEFRTDGSSNGRPIDYRTIGADSLVIRNTSFLNISGYLVRYDGSLLKTFVFDHNTAYVTGRQLFTNRLATQVINYQVTNNLVVNGYGFGDVPPVEGRLPNGVIELDSINVANGFTEAQRRIRIQNNGSVITPGLQAFYTERTNAGDPLVPYALIDDNVFRYATPNPAAIVSDNAAYNDLAFTTPGNVGDYITYLRNFRNGAVNAGIFFFGSTQLFPADQPPPENLAYATSNAAYTAAQCGYPLGDLNWFPARKAALAAGGCTVAAEDTPEGASGFALRAAFPNPATSQATVRFDLGDAATVTLDVYDALGRRVLSVPARTLAAGENQRATLDTSSLSSGIYLIRMTAETSGSVSTGTSRLTVVR